MKTKPCRSCGHGKRMHSQTNGVATHCRYSYKVRDGQNCMERDWNKPGGRVYTCQCPKWLPSEIWTMTSSGELEFAGYQDGMPAYG